MSVDATKVLVGAPDQAVTGAVLSAPLGTTAPTSAVGTLDAAFGDSGYVSEDGLDLTPNITTSDIKDWSGAIVRKILEEFDGTISWANLETNESSLETYFGDDYVTATAADATHGDQLAATMGAYDLPRKSWVFKMKDGDNRMLIYIPDGQVTNRDTVNFRRSNAALWGVTLSAYPDASGHAIYFYTDNGILAP